MLRFYVNQDRWERGGDQTGQGSLAACGAQGSRPRDPQKRLRDTYRRGRTPSRAGCCPRHPLHWPAPPPTRPAPPSRAGASFPASQAAAPSPHFLPPGARGRKCQWPWPAAACLSGYVRPRAGQPPTATPPLWESRLSFAGSAASTRPSLSTAWKRR